MKYFYLHIHASDISILGQDKSKIYLNSLPKDPIFQADGFWGLDKLDPSLIGNHRLKIKYEKIDGIELGGNILTNPNINAEDLPLFLYKLSFKGFAGQDDIGVFGNSYLVVSEYALELVRKEGVAHAEADLIDISIENYFSQNRHLFWMPESIRTKFIERFTIEKG